jgi:hypothetical protein
MKCRRMLIPITRPSAWPVAALMISTSAATIGIIHGSTIIDEIDPQAYRAEALLYPSVGKVTGSLFGGSGVLISERWVLTAGHVAMGKTGGMFTIGGIGYTVQASVTHPDYAFPNNFSDLGLLRLETAVTGVTPALMLGLSSSGELLGLEAAWVGFGIGGTGSTGAQGAFDHRAFTNVIDVFGPAYGLTSSAFIADFDKPDGSTNAAGSSPAATRLEGNVTSGDSGGGVFIESGGTNYLVGVISFTGGFSPGTNSRYGSISGASDLQQFHTWIFDQTGVSPIPDPSAALLGALAALGMLRRARCERPTSNIQH